MKKIVLIGAGQLGSRHLQALALLDEPAEIHVIDPSEAMRNIARIRFEEVEGYNRHQATFLKSLSDLHQTEVDMVIVATNSSVRYKVVLELLQQLRFQFLILEKFLFQRIADYQEVLQMLDERGVKCFVNCPRRMYPTYQELKKHILPESKLHMEVVGNNWGLGCNGIHFIDMFQWITGEFINQWSNQLAHGFMESKRKDYVEFSGRITGLSPSGKSLILTSFPTGQSNLSVRISTASHRFVVAEASGKVSHEIIADQKVTYEEYNFSSLFQSQLTHLIVDQLLQYGNCNLTPYRDAMNTHLPFLDLMLDHYNASLNEKTNICPIT